MACGAPSDDDVLNTGAGTDAGDAGNASSDGGPFCPQSVNPACNAAGGSCNGPDGTCEITEVFGDVPPDMQKQLEGSGKTDPQFRWLYPYDKTVFPRGLVSPTLQFDGSGPDAMYVHVTFPGMNYKGYFAKPENSRLQIPSKSWDAIGILAGKSAVKVEVTKYSNAGLSGPIRQDWIIAPGNLAGTIYHETYNSKIIGGPSVATPLGTFASGVGIMKFEPGKRDANGQAPAPTILKKGCANVCHAASADGSTLVASVDLYAPKNPTQYRGAFNSTSAVYDLKNDAKLVVGSNDQKFTFGALTPDGKYLMSATDYRTAGTDPVAGTTSSLFDTHTGNKVPAIGWDGLVQRGGTIAFSPDGKHIAYSLNNGKLPNYTPDTGRVNVDLWTMNFDQKTLTFSNPNRVVPSRDKVCVGWPAFTPDSKWILYHTSGNSWLESDGLNTGDLYGVEIASKQSIVLDALNGLDANGGTYLPANDPHLNFSPTMLPVAVGGYFWAVFTSHRSYGSILPSKAGSGTAGKLWVAAIDINAPAGKDPSHPAFYLDGQELGSNNLRGFWVLNPCQDAGQSCGSGADCCSGFCRGADGSPKCVAPPGGGACSKETEYCSADRDCCDSGAICINAHCATPVVR